MGAVAMGVGEEREERTEEIRVPLIPSLLYLDLVNQLKAGGAEL
jgi:hypothetical protein